MKRVKRTSRLLSVRLCLVIAALCAIPATSFAQIRLNEVEVDTPSEVSEPCEYVEVLGTPGATVPANTSFLSIDGDSGVFGLVNYIANIGGVQFGTNGTITIVTNSDVCAGRTFPAETTVVMSSSFAMGFGAETFLLVTSSNPTQLFEGQDLDQNDDGGLDATFGLTPIDGIGWVLDPGAINVVYGGAPKIFFGPATDVPDAATRFPNDLTAFS